MSDAFTRPGFGSPAQQHLIARHTGTGHADTTKFEWAVNNARDTLASCVGHYSLTSYLSAAENESNGRTKFLLLQRMIEPCGKPPAKVAAKTSDRIVIEAAEQ